MSAIKDILDKIDKLSPTDQERLKTIFLNKKSTMPREHHQRGHSTHVRGLSSEKACVPCAVNRNGMSIAKASNTGRVSTKDLYKLYDGRIDPAATLVIDKMNALWRALAVYLQSI